MRIPRLLRSTIIICLSISSAIAQSATGVISGSVLDTTGANVAGAKITLVDQDTNQTREATSNPAGVYEFRALPRGIYTIQAEMAGFKKEEIRSLQLTVAQTIQLDIRLELGQVTDSVTR